MGLGYHAVEALIREHKIRPISGDVVLIGRQAIYFRPDQILDLLREHDVPVQCNPADIEVDRVTTNRAPGAEGQDLITDSALLRLLGVPKVVALDHCDYEGAEIIHDLAKLIPRELHSCADFIIDGSTLDNVFDPAMVLRNLAGMLKPGGRLITHNVYSNHYEPYAILPPLWFLDFFVMNKFTDCKVYIVITPPGELRLMTLKQLDVFTVNTDYLLDPAKVVSTFTAPGVMATIVVAEKGYDSTSELMPTQQQYRSDADWLVYRENLRRMSRGRRPHVVRSLGEISVTDVKSGHLFVAHDFTGRDPATEIKRLNRQPRPMERDELICEQQTRLDEFQRLLANKDALLISQQQRLAEAEAQFRAITNSRSWRVTAPMRTMLGWLRNGAAP